MTYMFFIANENRKFVIDGEGTEGSLGEHLDYLARHGGTPDCWDSVDTDSRQEAINEAIPSNLHLYVVDSDIMRVVGEVNKP